MVRWRLAARATSWPASRSGLRSTVLAALSDFMAAWTVVSVLACRHSPLPGREQVNDAVLVQWRQSGD